MFSSIHVKDNRNVNIKPLCRIIWENCETDVIKIKYGSFAGEAVAHSAHPVRTPMLSIKLICALKNRSQSTTTGVFVHGYWYCTTHIGANHDIVFIIIFFFYSFICISFGYRSGRHWTARKRGGLNGGGGWRSVVG